MYIYKLGFYISDALVTIYIDAGVLNLYGSFAIFLVVHVLTAR